MTLLEKAIKTTARQKHALKDGEVDLVLAWLKSEVTSRQVAGALEKPASNIYPRIAIALKVAYQQGKIKIS